MKKRWVTSASSGGDDIRAGTNKGRTVSQWESRRGRLVAFKYKVTNGCSGVARDATQTAGRSRYIGDDKHG